MSSEDFYKEKSIKFVLCNKLTLSHLGVQRKMAGKEKHQTQRDILKQLWGMNLSSVGTAQMPENFPVKILKGEKTSNLVFLLVQNPDNIFFRTDYL